MSLPENETMVNFKSASFDVILLLHKGLTHIQSQIKPQLLFGERFTLNILNFERKVTFVSLFVCFSVDSDDSEDSDFEKSESSAESGISEELSESENEGKRRKTR